MDGKWGVGGYTLPKEKEEIGTQEQDIDGNQCPTGYSGFQAAEEVNRSGKHDQSLYRRDDPSVMIIIPIGNRAFKSKIGERKEMMMSVVVMRYKVEPAMEEHTPRTDDGSLGVQ